MANSCKFILICKEERYRSYMVLPVAKCAGYVVLPRCFDVDTWFCLPSLSNMAADGAKFYSRTCAFKLRFQICKNIKITQNVTYMVLPCGIRPSNQGNVSPGSMHFSFSNAMPKMVHEESNQTRFTIDQQEHGITYPRRWLTQNPSIPSRID